jgi:hypothetical protein
LEDIRKVSICLTIILVVLYSGICCFAITPANADMFSPYTPDIIYLGRHNNLEHDRLPSDPEDPDSQCIYASVRDIYNQNLHGKLSYTAFNNINTKIGTVNMKLINGNLTNGTWMGEIPKQNLNVPYTVHYNAYFKDDLNHSVTESGPTGNDYNFAIGQGYNVTYRYIEDSMNSKSQGQPQNSTGFTAIVSDKRTNMPYEVTLHYKLNNDTKSYQWHHKIMNPSIDPETNKLYPIENEYDDVIHKYYSTHLKLSNHTKVSRFYSTLHDSGGKDINSTSVTPPPFPKLHYISVRANVWGIDVSNKKAEMRIILDSPLKRDKPMSSTQRYSVGDPESINLQLKDNNNNSTVNIPGSFPHLTYIIYPEKYRSFHADIGGGILTLTGNSSSFPYDHYSANLTIKIPLRTNITDDKARYEPSYLTAWANSPPWKINSAWDRTGNTFLKIYKDFERNNFYFTTLILPILLVFFLLGIICFLEPEEHYLVARIAITLGVFAFVFTFVDILEHVKPDSIKGITTFADFLLKLVLFAAIASTIGSVMGAAMKKISNKWAEKIHTYRLYDVLAAALVLVISVSDLAIARQYTLENSQVVFFIGITFVGLMWGLLSRVIYYQIGRRKTKRKKEEKPVSKEEVRRVSIIAELAREEKQRQEHTLDTEDRTSQNAIHI